MEDAIFNNDNWEKTFRLSLYQNVRTSREHKWNVSKTARCIKNPISPFFSLQLKFRISKGAIPSSCFEALFDLRHLSVLETDFKSFHI